MGQSESHVKDNGQRESRHRQNKTSVLITKLQVIQSKQLMWSIVFVFLE